METESETIAKVLDDFTYLITIGDIGSTIATDVKNRIEVAHRREVAELRECLKEATELICDTYCESDNCDCCARNTKWRKALEGANDEGK